MAGMYGCFKGRNSDSAAMASGPPDVLTNQEPAEDVEECSGKKKSKFQTFKKFFARKKRKEPPAAGAEAGLKASQSTDNVSKTSENNTLTRSEKDKGSGSKISLGSKALSHDSIFVSDSSEATEALGASQDNIHGKVKSLQLQLRQAIRLGSPPSLMCVKRTDDGGTMSEDDGLPCSPPEYTPLHVAMSQNQAQRDSSISLEGIDSDSDQLSCAASSRAVSPLVVPGDFSQPASPFGCLDNSAAKHKLGLRLKACNRRKPVRLEMKAEGESVVEETTEERQEATEVVSGDELKPKRGEDEEEEEEEKRRLLRDEEEREEEESKAEKDVSHDPDSSSPPEPGLSEEGGPDTQPQSSSKPGSRPSSLDTPGATPEPPAGPREYLLDPPGIAYGVELKRVESDLTLSGDEDGVQEIREEEEEESSFLQEVLSSLKTPLASCSLGLESEGVTLEIEEEQEEEKEQEDVEEVKDEEDAEVDETVGYQAAPAASFLSDQTEEDEEEEEEEEEEEATLNTPSCRDVDEEEKAEEEAAAEEESSPHRQEEEGEKEEAEEEEVEEEEAKEVTSEEEDHMLTGNTVNQAEEEGREEEEEEEESEGEMEAIELEKEVEKEEEGREKREEEDEEAELKEAKERVEEAEEAMEEEEAEEMFPDAADEDVAVATREECEGVDVVVGDDDEAEPVHESQAESEQEREGGDEKVEEGEHTGQRSEEEEEEEEANRPDEGQSEPDEVIETSHEAEEQAVASKPPSLSLPESHDETQSQHSGPSTPSKTSTLHINLLSPSSEKTAASFFQQSPTEEEAPRHAEAAAEKHAEEEGEPADSVEVPEEEKQLEPEGEAPPPLSVEGEAPPPASVEGEAPPPVEGEVNQPSGGSDHCKDQFTDKEEGSPSPSSSSPSAATAPGGEEVEEEKEEAKEDPATPAKVELVLSPGRVRNAGSGSPSSTNAEERSGGVEGNNPFGVRLRKTSALHRFSSEEENTEAPAEPPAQPTSCRVDSPQPITTKPSVSQPISSKPSLPKKPDVPGDAGGKNKRMSDPAPLRGVSGGSESPSWISVAKQKQKIYKENSLEEISVRKEEQERKSSLPMFVSSAGRESTGKVSPLEVSRPSASIEKETRRSLSPPTPVPPQPPKSQSLPCPVPPKPQLPPATAKHPPQPNSPQRSLSPPTPIPQKSPSCTSPPSPSKTATSSSKLTSPPFSSRTGPDKSGSRAPGLSSQTLTSQRGLPPAALPQDEPPWMALAKKKAKAWSEMPQIVQ